MNKSELQSVINNLERNEEKFVQQLRSDPGLAVQILFVVQRILKFKERNGYDDNGQPKKLSMWRLLWKKAIRRELVDIIEQVIRIFKPSK